MTSMVSLVRVLKKPGATLFCWSTAGASYARKAADELGLHPSACASLTASEPLQAAMRGPS